MVNECMKQLFTSAVSDTSRERPFGAPTREKTMLQFILSLIIGDNNIKPW